MQEPQPITEKSKKGLTLKQKLGRIGAAIGLATASAVGGGYVAEKVLQKQPHSQQNEGEQLAEINELLRRTEHLRSLNPDTHPTVQRIWMGTGTLKGQYPNRGMGVLVSNEWKEGNKDEALQRVLSKIPSASPKFAPPTKEYNFGETWLNIPQKDGSIEKAFLLDATNAMRIHKSDGTPFHFNKESLAVPSFSISLLGPYPDQSLPTGLGWTVALIPEKQIPPHDYIFVGTNFGDPKETNQMVDDSDLNLRWANTNNHNSTEKQLAIFFYRKIESVAVWFADKNGLLVGYGEFSPPQTTK